MKLVPLRLHAAMCLTLALIIAPCVACAHEETLSPEALERIWLQAVINRDLGMLDRILDASFVETLSSGVRRSKADVLAAPPPPPGSTQELEDLQIKTYGDVAIVRGINKFRRAGETSSTDFVFTDVLVRFDGNWRAVSSQMTVQMRK